MLRRSNLCAASDSLSCIRVQEVSFTANDLQVSVPVLKIGRFLGQHIDIPLNRVENSILCSVKAFEQFETESTLGEDEPLFSYKNNRGDVISLSADKFS